MPDYREQDEEDDVAVLEFIQEQPPLHNPPHAESGRRPHAENGTGLHTETQLKAKATITVAI